MNKLLLLCALAVSAACTSFSILDVELPKYFGRPAEALISRLGLPDAEQTLAGRRVYVWSTSTQYTRITPVTTTNTGFVGSSPVMTASTAPRATTGSLSCRVRVWVDANDLIQGADYDGNNAACFTFSSRLR